jgi:hypothetical protein
VVGDFTKRPIRKGKYNMAPHFYRNHPDKYCAQEIRSLNSTDGLQIHGETAPILAGDETTWLSRGPRCRYEAMEDPHGEE